MYVFLFRLVLRHFGSPWLNVKVQLIRAEAATCLLDMIKCNEMGKWCSFLHPLPYFVCPSKAKHAAHEKKETKQRAKVSTEFQSVIVWKEVSERVCVCVCV